MLLSWYTLGLAALCHGQSFVQFVGNEAGKAYTFKCTKDGASAAGLKIEVNDCKAKKCPQVSVNEDGRFGFETIPIFSLLRKNITHRDFLKILFFIKNSISIILSVNFRLYQ